ncbi:putative MFS transporter [Xylariaceae sp. FL0255]|nr:putative MFS transporter [Xylariaceae sp. FL0255]
MSSLPRCDAKSDETPEDGKQADIAQPQVPHEIQQELPYSTFTRQQKIWIIAIAAWAGWFSTASSFAYFPAIPFMATQMHVSVERINLTVTSYLIASGIFPTVTGSIADRYGRRVTLLASISAYVVVNIGLAVQSSFPALFVLRMLQSVAISGGYSITYGVVSDLASPAERGGYTGAVAVFLNTPPSVAPLISGLLLLRWTWPSIFWFLSIASAVVFIVTALFLPETGRNVVGNGSGIRIGPTTNITKAPFFRILCPPKDSTSTVHMQQPSERRTKVNFNPLSAILILKNRNTLIASTCFGVYYTVQSCLQASLSTIFVETYNVTGLVAGLIYIPFGIGCSVASFAGRIVDHDYKVAAAKQGFTINRISGDDLAGFPIERARLRSCKYSILVCAPLIIGYGWTLQVKTNMAAPLILQFLIGFSNQLLYTCINTLLLDYWPNLGASVQAANNFVRCELAAAGLAALDPLLRALGPGWCFVVFAGLHFATFVGFIILEAKGLSWRSKR